MYRLYYDKTHPKYKLSNVLYNSSNLEKNIYQRKINYEKNPL